MIRHQPSPGAGQRPVECGVEGQFVELDGVEMYRISSFDKMPPFLMSLVSASDHWMYVSSGGALAAGRVEPEHSLFPYETDDRLYRAGGRTGPFTLLRVEDAQDSTTLWEPFTGGAGDGSVRRNLYKSLIGDTIVFEEVRADLGLTFRYRWNTSAEWGLVRTSTLASNRPSGTTNVRMLDGLRNVMPANVSLGMQQSRSTLAEAYRRNEIDPETTMAIYSLEARITDRAEPAESLHANIVWSTGLPDATVVLSADQIATFRRGLDLTTESPTRGTRADYLLNATISLEGDSSRSWLIVGNVHQSQLDVQECRSRLIADSDLAETIAADIRLGSDRLQTLVASADGQQCTNDKLTTTHHFANTLFNCMRGGVLIDNGSVPVTDLTRFIEQRNRAVHRVHSEWLATLGDQIDRQQLLGRAADRGDPDLERLCHEYIPLAFSRRHGDPSRPWNMFAINVEDDDGKRSLDYQGNWRDIFQNWEALCFSFPGYFESVVAKFVNASTPDGFNPYRVTRDGIDWEVEDPDSEWSNIGYWGDHQIIYLLRLLEGLNTFDPSALPRMMGREVFSYGDVPYRIRSYDAILRDAKNTIEFDHGMDREIADRAALVGSDGRLVLDAEGSVVHVNLAEKLLVPALTKLANLVVDGGVWMNTQRPEWNDANNALVGYGLSMVTVAYLRRYLAFCEDLFSSVQESEFVISTEVASWLEQTLSILTEYHDRLDQPAVSDRRRKRLLDRLGTVFSDYRASVYEHGFTGKAMVSTATIVELCRVAGGYAAHSIRANRRPSGLYHSYNLVAIEDDGRQMSVDPLPVMLEGQVAAISSGLLSSEEVLVILDALYQSDLYRADQNSFVLYPARELPSFLERNKIAETDVAANPLLTRLLSAGDNTVIERDALGHCRFSPEAASLTGLGDALDRLSADPDWTELVVAERTNMAELFESVFQHRRFTGRSGSMYKYEGLGSIYWHMVAKLLLAVQESFWSARSAGEPEGVQSALADGYYRIRAGLSSAKTPTEYGAFPTDPYSHSPVHMGAQQPGMTGQVKEEILTRWGELGLRVKNGRLSFDPILLRSGEFLKEGTAWSYYDTSGAQQTIDLPPESLGFTYCQVPIIYRLGEPGIIVTWVDGGHDRMAGATLDQETSDALFRRLGTVTRIEVTLDQSLLAEDAPDDLISVPPSSIR